MPLLRPLDPAFPIERQTKIDASPVVLVNIFTMDKADEQAFLTVWQDDAAFMKQQPGFISTQLLRAIGGCHRCVPHRSRYEGLGSLTRKGWVMNTPGKKQQDRSQVSILFGFTVIHLSPQSGVPALNSGQEKF
jgi:hypothetical protein